MPLLVRDQAWEGPLIEGPFIPLGAGAGTVAGPGGQTLFAEARGTVWMAYHAWTAPRIGYDAGGVRGLGIDRLRFVNGVPVLDGPSTTAQPLE